MSPTYDHESHDSLLLRTVEAGWKEALEEIRKAEAERTNVVQRELRRMRAEIAEQTRRYRIVVRALIGAVLVGIVVVTMGLLALTAQQRTLSSQQATLTEQQGEQMASRRKALVDVCRALNGLSHGILGFVDHAAPNLLPYAEGRFPVEPNCAAYAERLVQQQP